MRAVTVRAQSRRTTPSLIATMSLQLAIPRRVALQQRPLPLHQPPPSSYGLFSVPSFLQRMVNCPQFHCLNSRVQSFFCPLFPVPYFLLEFTQREMDDVVVVQLLGT